MSGARAGWMVAASIGAVESLKDQLGVCRWNYAFRSMQQSAKSRLQSYYNTSVGQPKQSSSSSVAAKSTGVVGNKVARDLERLKRTEKCMEQVMDLSCWGPTTVRF